jgi:hypothetical protein
MNNSFVSFIGRQRILPAHHEVSLEIKDMITKEIPKYAKNYESNYNMLKKHSTPPEKAL